MGALGKPCWIDLTVGNQQDRDALVAFCFGAFAWTAEIGLPETGQYTTLLRSGDPVAAIGQRDRAVGQSDAQSDAAWITYFATSDIDATAARVTSLGGTVTVAPTQVMQRGSRAVCVDPVGAMFGLWQAQDFTGFADAFTAGYPVWFDHGSADPARARDFYAALFDLSASDDGTMLGDGDRHYFSVSTGVAGNPADWKPVIAIDSLSDLEGFVTSAGGKIYASQVPVPGGTATTFADPVVGAPLIAFHITA